MGPTCYPETSVTNYQPTLHNIPEERRSQQNITFKALLQQQLHRALWDKYSRSFWDFVDGNVGV
jgi:hypothetical protein